MRYLLVAICLVFMVVPVTAQDDGETIALSGAFHITVPDDWVVDRYMASGFLWETDDSAIRIRTYSPLTQRTFEIEGVDAILEYLVVESFGARSVDEDLIETVQFGDYEGMSYTFEEIAEGIRYMRGVYAYPIENDFVVVGYIKPLSGHDLNEEDVEALQTALATVSQQDTFVFLEGTRLDIPEDWQMTQDVNEFFAAIGLTNGSIEFRLSLWPSYGAIEGLEDPAAFLAYFADGYLTDVEAYDRSKLQETTIAGFEAVLYPFSVETVNADGVYDRAVIAFNLPANNSAFTVWITTKSSDESYDAIYDVLDALEPGTILVCAVITGAGDRIRAEPTTSSEMVRQTDRESLVAVRQFTDDAGYVWFDVTEGWVRSDVVFYDVNTCVGIPEKR